MLTKLMKIRQKTISLIGLMLLFPAFVFGQIINGTVTTDEEESLIGATVVIKGTNIGTITDSNGFFSLNTDGRGEVLVVSFIGNVTQEIAINKKKSLISFLDKDVKNPG